LRAVTEIARRGGIEIDDIRNNMRMDNLNGTLNKDRENWKTTYKICLIIPSPDKWWTIDFNE
jgi:hypothetical protein